MPQWELKNHWVPLDTNTNTPEDYPWSIFVYGPSFGNAFSAAWTEAELLANAGWELVSVTPASAGIMMGKLFDPEMPDAQSQLYGQLGQSYGHGCSYTTGFFFVFKRLKS